MASRKQKSILKFKDSEFLDLFEHLLLETGKVKVTGLGIFEIRHIDERKGYNVGSGRMITIKAHNKILFKLSKKLRDSIQKYEGQRA